MTNASIDLPGDIETLEAMLADCDRIIIKKAIYKRNYSESNERLLVSLVMFGCCLILSQFDRESLWWDAGEAVLASLAYIVAIAVIDRDFWTQTRRYGRKIVS